MIKLSRDAGLNRSELEIKFRKNKYAAGRFSPSQKTSPTGGLYAMRVKALFCCFQIYLLSTSKRLMHPCFDGLNE